MQGLGIYFEQVPTRYWGRDYGTKAVKVHSVSYSLPQLILGAILLISVPYGHASMAARIPLLRFRAQFQWRVPLCRIDRSQYRNIWSSQNNARSINFSLMYFIPYQVAPIWRMLILIKLTVIECCRKLWKGHQGILVVLDDAYYRSKW